MTYSVGIVPVPEPDDGPSEDMKAVADLQHRVHLDESGHDDWGSGAEAKSRDYASQQHTGKLYVLARDVGTAVGTVAAWWDKAADRPTGYFNVAVPDEHFTPELADELWQATREALIGSGVGSIQCWIPRPVPTETDDADWIVPAVGSGAVPADHWSEWFAGAGFTLEQASAAQLMHVDEGLQLCHRLDYKKPQGYATHTWHGPIPESLLEGMVSIRNRMPIDAPNAGFDVDERQVDAEQLRSSEARIAQHGESVISTAAIHEASGDIVGYTCLHVMPSGEAACQEDTLVRSDHRGHRIGLALKVANLRALAEEHPAAQRVHTWNAAENTHMIAINERIGFREVGVEAGWQWKPTSV